MSALSKNLPNHLKINDLTSSSSKKGLPITTPDSFTVGVAGDSKSSEKKEDNIISRKQPSFPAQSRYAAAMKSESKANQATMINKITSNPVLQSNTPSGDERGNKGTLSFSSESKKGGSSSSKLLVSPSQKQLTEGIMGFHENEEEPTESQDDSLGLLLKTPNKATKNQTLKASLGAKTDNQTPSVNKNATKTSNVQVEEENEEETRVESADKLKKSINKHSEIEVEVDVEENGKQSTKIPKSDLKHTSVTKHPGEDNIEFEHSEKDSRKILTLIEDSDKDCDDPNKAETIRSRSSSSSESSIQSSSDDDAERRQNKKNKKNKKLNHNDDKRKLDDGLKKLKLSPIVKKTDTIPKVQHSSTFEHAVGNTKRSNKKGSKIPVKDPVEKGQSTPTPTIAAVRESEKSNPIDIPVKNDDEIKKISKEPVISKKGNSKLQETKSNKSKAKSKQELEENDDDDDDAEIKPEKEPKQTKKKKKEEKKRQPNTDTSELENEVLSGREAFTEKAKAEAVVSSYDRELFQVLQRSASFKNIRVSIDMVTCAETGDEKSTRGTGVEKSTLDNEMADGLRGMSEYTLAQIHLNLISIACLMSGATSYKISIEKVSASDDTNIISRSDNSQRVWQKNDGLIPGVPESVIVGDVCDFLKRKLLGRLTPTCSTEKGKGQFLGDCKEDQKQRKKKSTSDSEDLSYDDKEHDGEGLKSLLSAKVTRTQRHKLESKLNNLLNDIEASEWTADNKEYKSLVVSCRVADKFTKEYFKRHGESSDTTTARMILSGGQLFSFVVRIPRGDCKLPLLKEKFDGVSIPPVLAKAFMKMSQQSGDFADLEDENLRVFRSLIDFLCFDYSKDKSRGSETNVFAEVAKDSKKPKFDPLFGDGSEYVCDSFFTKGDQPYNNLSTDRWRLPFVLSIMLHMAKYMLRDDPVRLKDFFVYERNPTNHTDQSKLINQKKIQTTTVIAGGMNGHRKDINPTSKHQPSHEAEELNSKKKKGGNHAGKSEFALAVAFAAEQYFRDLPAKFAGINKSELGEAAVNELYNLNPYKYPLKAVAKKIRSKMEEIFSKLGKPTAEVGSEDVLRILLRIKRLFNLGNESERATAIGMLVHCSLIIKNCRVYRNQSSTTMTKIRLDLKEEDTSACIDKPTKLQIDVDDVQKEDDEEINFANEEETSKLNILTSSTKSLAFKRGHDGANVGSKEHEEEEDDERLSSAQTDSVIDAAHDEEEDNDDEDEQFAEPSHGKRKSLQDKYPLSIERLTKKGRKEKVGSYKLSDLDGEGEPGKSIGIILNLSEFAKFGPTLQSFEENFADFTSKDALVLSKHFRKE